MVKMNGFAAIDSVRPFHLWTDKAAIAADFHLRKWHLLLWETENSKHSLCCHTRHLHPQLAKLQLDFASRARRYPLVRTCWETSQIL